MTPVASEPGTPEWVREVCNEAVPVVEKLVDFARAVHKLKLGASGGRVTLAKAECQAIIWALQQLRSRDGLSE